MQTVFCSGTIMQLHAITCDCMQLHAIACDRIDNCLISWKYFGNEKQDWKFARSVSSTTVTRFIIIIFFYFLKKEEMRSGTHFSQQTCFFQPTNLENQQMALAAEKKIPPTPSSSYANTKYQQNRWKMSHMGISCARCDEKRRNPIKRGSL